MKKTAAIRKSKYETLSVDKKTVVELWGLPYEESNEEEGIKVLEDVITDHTRWSVVHKLLVEIKGKTYETSYSVAATEGQDEQPWQYDDEVDFIEVRPIEKVVIVWEKVEKVPIQ